MDVDVVVLHFHEQAYSLRVMTWSIEGDFSLCCREHGRVHGAFVALASLQKRSARSPSVG